MYCDFVTGSQRSSSGQSTTVVWYIILSEYVTYSKLYTNRRQGIQNTDKECKISIFTD